MPPPGEMSSPRGGLSAAPSAVKARAEAGAASLGLGVDGGRLVLLERVARRVALVKGLGVDLVLLAPMLG